MSAARSGAAEAHVEFARRVKPARGCGRHDMNYGGSCFNCGYDPNLAEAARNVRRNAMLADATPPAPSGERPTQAQILAGLWRFASEARDGNNVKLGEWGRQPGMTWSARAATIRDCARALGLGDEFEEAIR